MADLDPAPRVGGHAALDFVNSVERGIPVPGRAQVDWLPDIGAAHRWAVDAGLISAPEADGAERACTRSERAGTAFAELVALRESAYTVFLGCLGQVGWDDAGTVAAMTVLRDRWRGSVARSRLAPAPHGAGIDVVYGLDPTWLLVDRAAASVLDLLTAETIDRLKICPLDEGGCGWLFLDASRNGSRRWCRMADCGARVKATRLTDAVP
jgi:predicted RNA-binding Zn ribbon-like protein